MTITIQSNIASISDLAKIAVSKKTDLGDLRKTYHPIAGISTIKPSSNDAIPTYDIFMKSEEENYLNILLSPLSASEASVLSSLVTCVELSSTLNGLYVYSEKQANHCKTIQDATKIILDHRQSIDSRHLSNGAILVVSPSSGKNPIVIKSKVFLNSSESALAAILEKVIH